MSPKLELLESLLLPDFPSGSSINYYDEKFYVIGDDAKDIFMLDKNYQKIDSIHLFDYPDKRIPKKEKADYESSLVITLEGKAYLVVNGSASNKKRMKLILIALEKEGHEFEVFQFDEFVERLTVMGISEINLEGATRMGKHLVLANRGNGADPVNYLITTEINFWQCQHKATINISKLSVSTGNESFVGVSELCYLDAKDCLLLTFTSELTNNAYDDGMIGDSYLGWIENVMGKMNMPTIKLDGMINLLNVSKEFKGEKIEGICVESVTESELNVHLVSDNDQGQTKLFKVRMTI